MRRPPPDQRKGPHQKFGWARREVDNNRYLPKIPDDVKAFVALWSWSIPFVALLLLGAMR